MMKVLNSTKKGLVIRNHIIRKYDDKVRLFAKNEMNSYARDKSSAWNMLGAYLRAREQSHASH